MAAPAYLNTSDLKALDDLIYMINSRSSIHDIQKEVLEELRKLVPYGGATFYLPGRKGSNHILSSPVYVDCDEDLIREYEEYYQQIDYLLWIFHLSEPLTYRETDLIQESLRQKSPFYNDFIKHAGFHYVSGLSIIHQKALCGAITLFRTRNSRDFDGRELSILSYLQRHLGNRLYQLLNSSHVDLPEIRLQPVEEQAGVFTSREREIAELVSRGLDTERIAVSLCISPKTVKKHLDNMFKKANIHSRLQLVQIVHNSTCNKNLLYK